MDFIIGLPKNFKHHDSIMVEVDKICKETQFILVKSTCKTVNIVDIFMKEIFRLHGIQKVIILDRDVKFRGNFWKALFKGLGTQLNFNTAYHPQMDGQMERVNLILEDMLGMYVMDKPGKCEDYLHLVEFAYNNHFHVSSRTSPFDILYGRKCNTPISYISPIDRLMLGPKLLKDMELTVKQV